MKELVKILEQKLKEVEHVFCLIDDLEPNNPAKYFIGLTLDGLRGALKILKLQEAQKNIACLCDMCQAPISQGDLDKGVAIKRILVPESEHTPEVREALCMVCLQEEGVK